MKYLVETYEAGVRVDVIEFDGTAEDAKAFAKAHKTPDNINFIRVVEPVGNEGGVEIWSERRDQ